MSVLVTKQAPDFSASAVLADGSIVDDFQLSSLKGKKIVIFFYPLDFTFVCPSEILAHHHRVADFKERGVELVGISIDSKFTHNAWRNTAINDGGIGQIDFPLVADVDHSIMESYGVVHPDSLALRGSFLIDEEFTVRHQVVNDLPLGRNVDEMLRMVDALEFHTQNGEVCPAGWNKGDDGMKDTPEGVAEYLSKNADNL
ncbi:MAG TPA: alkyl hydroperoxide reductase [Gammaproteobacteria bacterium]|jgi:peroxiredoxin (alkyl hydroperoxide reductase subunit C)|nr:peroxiredoxin [Gammaproteobacteria bacterium]HAY40850.1 alkyl hydroperoxide reductase [Gammaproteobacteria bacterium]|tara:strand:- start:537 stop:1136 length:600 start_codon:yes stop_codon:yes gene_type:complete